ncbi:IS5/IS1182 family transposase [Amycolatopsis sp. NBC_00345]|uniref:IS5/IS1182 family transposase n=1 Tax=Amycolatopsis sp. NBC_00345 TaxID=2975955 RepID=UPI002E26B7A6
MISCGATLDGARELALFVAGVLGAERRRRGTRRGRRALTPYRQAVLVLRWFRDATPVHWLAADHHISIATAYRYLHEAITALDAHTPDLHQVLQQRRAAGDTHVILDGTPIPAARVAATTIKTKGKNRGATVHLWYSGKHRSFGGNIQFLAGADGFPLWASPVLPGSRNDLSATGILTPVKKATGQPPLATDQQTSNLLHTRLRALGERAAALLKTRRQALHRITLCPEHIGTIVQAALVLTHHEHHRRY